MSDLLHRLRVLNQWNGLITFFGMLATVGLLVEPAVGQANENAAETVGMTSTLEFTPDTVRIAVGKTVRWKNSSMIVHTVTADPKKATKEESVRLPEGASAFDSGNLDPEATFKHTFTVPGTYRYFCVPHEGTKMYGTVIVESSD